MQPSSARLRSGTRAARLQPLVPGPEATALIRGASRGLQSGQMRRFEGQDASRVTIGP